MYSYLYIGIESRLSESIMFQLYEEFSISGEDKNYTLHIERPKIGTLGMYNSKKYCFSIFYSFIALQLSSSKKIVNNLFILFASVELKHD